MLFIKLFSPYNATERKGLIALLSVIAILQLIYYFYPFTKNKDTLFELNSPEIIAFQQRVDSIKQIEIERRKPKIYPFNPSFLTDYKASKFGMDLAQIDRLFAYRKSGKYINSAKEFQAVTQISDSLLSIMQPYFKFPDWVTSRQNKGAYNKIYPFNPSFLSESKGLRLGLSQTEINKLLQHRKAGKYINSALEFQKVTGISTGLLNKISPYFKYPDWVVAKQQEKELEKIETGKNQVPIAKFTGKKQDINLVSKLELERVNGISQKLAKRIISYRKKLKGYTYDTQLYEVWGLDSVTTSQILAHYTVLSKPNITKININTAGFKEVLHLPYIDYELTKKIFNFRDEVAELQSLEELKKIDSFPSSKFERISLYLKAE